jgi:hypothetical protein
MMNYSRLIVVILLICIGFNLQAQNDSLNTDEIIDYSQFGDASGVRRYATQKTLNQSPTRIISIGYEYQAGFFMPQVPQENISNTKVDYNVRSMSGLRAQVNLPVISNDKIIWQIGVNYWGSQILLKEVPLSRFEQILQNNGLHTAGFQTTVFKPLDEKHFLILQASADANATFHKLTDVNYKAITYSGTAIYGWKYSERKMFGLGLARTYRAGALLHVPVLLWNQTFNDKYGMELLLPARGYIRRNFSTSSMLQLGYELEGNQFYMPDAGNNNELFIQRGELKPKIMWDQKISGFIWLNLQAGLRFNWRFDAINTYDGRGNSELFYSAQLGNPLYFAMSLNFVSP